MVACFGLGGVCVRERRGGRGLLALELTSEREAQQTYIHLPGSARWMLAKSSATVLCPVSTRPKPLTSSSMVRLQG